ncbi:hypothetical protein B0H34DRAFT_800411 [Crassisporium funariophilum]|nr:hypothetical protein B0H34DRAFT_800411 [Crassisporium funariophilum]
MSPAQEPAPYATIPIPNAPVYASADIAEWFATEMSLAHNLIIRGINSIWINAPLVKPGDVVAFAGYTLACLKMIHEHHEGEEKVVFPRLQSKLDMGHNVEQHEAFHDHMVALEEYMTKVHAGQEKYDAERTRRMVKDFADPLVEHLTEEIPTISPKKLSVFTAEELTEMNNALGEHIKNGGGFFTVFPFGMTTHNRQEAPDWPPVPWVIKWFALNIGYFVNRSYWKFSPYTRTGVPQTYTG